MKGIGVGGSKGMATMMMMRGETLGEVVSSLEGEFVCYSG